MTRQMSLQGKIRSESSLPIPFALYDDDPSYRELSSYTTPSPRRYPPLPSAQGDPVIFTDNPFSESLPSTPNTTRSPDTTRYIFRLLEGYIISCFSNVECLNASFQANRPQAIKAASESDVVEPCVALGTVKRTTLETPLPEMDAKTLLVGDFVENGMWWTGRSQLQHHQTRRLPEDNWEGKMNSRSPRVNWMDVNEWYRTVVYVGHSWRERLQALRDNDSLTQAATEWLGRITPELEKQIDREMTDACAHVQWTLLKATEDLLRRPKRPLKTIKDSRFLLLLLSNPLLYASDVHESLNVFSMEAMTNRDQVPAPRRPSITPQKHLMNAQKSPSTRNESVGRHSGITKCILGLLSNLPIDCHQYLVNCFSRFSEPQFQSLVDLIGSFVAYRLSRQYGRNHSNSRDLSGGLIPNISGLGAGTSAHLHAALGIARPPNPNEKPEIGVLYCEDWQIKAAARVMSLLFSANRLGSSRHQEGYREQQILPISAFYNTRLDYSDLVADFEMWESRRGKFSFCQYPMFLSIWAKIKIMEHDAHRQMEIKAREAFFNSIMTRKASNQYLVLKIRRDCLVEDSLTGVSEVVGQGQEEIKKGLKIEFEGEEGLDSGGLRKEWFLLLVREVFDQDHGLFVYDEESHYCYFNANSFETSDQFFLVGVLLGLAIYNSTILDVALPPFAFRKLLASAPNYTGPETSSLRPAARYTLKDLAEFRPLLAGGLKQMLEFDGNVEDTYCRDFVAVVERYGQREQVPLCHNGENRAVTNENRREFVDLYIRYLLDVSVARQYEPFKRGFFTVCGGNALSLFAPEEIELLVRGSDEPLDIATLRTVAIYDGWESGKHPAEEPVVIWFWEAFLAANAREQRKLLSFITASDRIPAMGATSLVIKITCLGDHSQRFPIARTCFNMLGLYRYASNEVLKDKLWTAVIESEGFGMK